MEKEQGENVTNSTTNVTISNVTSTGARVVRQVQILRCVSDHILPVDEICKKFNIKRPAFYRALKRYRKKGWINIDRTLTDAGIKLIKSVTTTHGTLETVTKSMPQDTIRTHNLTFTLSIPKIHNWIKRRHYLEDKKIHFVKIARLNSERIIIDNRKIWLTPKSIIFYIRKSFYNDTAEENMHEALDDLFGLINKLETRLNIRLKHADGYHIRISRQHHALIKNVLAKQYNIQGKKLYVRNQEGLWLLIDHSLSQHELETVHPKTALDDNRPVLDFFNDLKENPATISDINNALMNTAKILQGSVQTQENFKKDVDEYGKNIKLHLQVLTSMDDTLKKIKENLK